MEKAEGNVMEDKRETAPAHKERERQDAGKIAGTSERELLIQEYERRLALLKSGASPGEVIFKV